MSRIDAFFKLMRDQEASYLHLASGRSPSLRIMGNITRVKYHKMLDDELKEILYEILPEQKAKIFKETGKTHFAYEIPSYGRYRICVYMQQQGVAAVFKAIPKTIRTVQELNLPRVVSRLASLPKGLVFVDGPKESGKSTTLAAIIDEANRTRKDHIITIEDPIEYVHQNKGCIIDQQEVGIHTQSFVDGLRNALRADPDIILVGEMRDPETVSLALEAASSHLVLATLPKELGPFRHWPFERIIDIYPMHMQSFIRSKLADVIRGGIGQVLFKRIDTTGYCAGLQVFIATPAARNLIRESKTHAFASVIQVGRKYEMQLLDDAIMKLLKKGWISSDEAYLKANDKARFRSFLKHPPLDFTTV